MTERFPSAFYEEQGGVTTCFANIPVLFFNVSILDRPATDEADFRELLVEAAARTKHCPYPTGVILREDWVPEEWVEILKEFGLVPMIPMTGMETSELLPRRRPSPGGLEIRPVADDATAGDLAEVNALAYGMPVEAFDPIANMNLWRKESYGFVGYAEGKAVSTAAVFPVDGVAYVALVATRPEAQGKGYADAVMRNAVDAGRGAMGVSATALHATDMGLPVYRAMGYVAGARLHFVCPPH